MAGPFVPKPIEPIIATTLKNQLGGKLVQAARSSWLEAFYGDGVASRKGADAIAATLATFMGWLQDMEASGDVAINPNAAFQLITNPSGLALPDGWVLTVDGDKNLFSVITDGMWGPNALRLTGDGTTTIEMRSPLVPIHPDWIYMAGAAFRVSNASCTFTVRVRLYDRDGEFLDTVPSGSGQILEYQTGTHALDEWHDKIDDPSLIGAPPPEPTFRAATVDSDARFAQIRIQAFAPDGETVDIDWGRITRVPALAACFLNNTVASLTSGIFHNLGCDEEVMDRGDNMAVEGTGTTISGASNTANAWTAPYDMPVRVKVFNGFTAQVDRNLVRARIGGFANSSSLGPEAQGQIEGGGGSARGGSGSLEFFARKDDVVRADILHVSGAARTLNGVANTQLTGWSIEEISTW